jgi:nitrogen fixation/metabolism regulation signal transduction histidine kinase
MIDELSESAGLLAKSERESAWREMAKQVAHEIKNPLTPMKLNVQHLRKAWEEKAEDWDERLDKFAETLIEQIESLSQIASEFSDFANMPQTKVEKVELSEVINNSIELHKNYDNIQLEYLTDETLPLYVLADRKQVLRVFNNLIKNSIQAIGNKEGGRIKISVESMHESYMIKVSDNGSGISEEKGDKIFIPSFTTKSSGMGLGLSMVRSIVLSAGGNIRYTSEVGEGTTFYITLPKFAEEEKEAAAGGNHPD